MSLSVWNQTLSIQQSFHILRQCSLFLYSQYEPDKICFYPTRIELEENSMLWRTGAKLYGGFQKLVWGTDLEFSRDLEKLVILIGKVHTCLKNRDINFRDYVKDSLGKKYAWVVLLKEAKDGLTRLKDQQYAGNVDKQNFVMQASNDLAEAEKLFNTDEFELQQLMEKLSQEDADTLREILRKKDERIHQLENKFPLPIIIPH